MLKAVCDLHPAGTRGKQLFPILTCMAIWRPSQKTHTLRDAPFHSCTSGTRKREKSSRILALLKTYYSRQTCRQTHA